MRSPRRKQRTKRTCQERHASDNSGVKASEIVMSSKKGIAQSDRTRKLRHLHELIAALDRRVPRLERIGEIDIAREGRAVREKTLQRIAELEASLETNQPEEPLPD